MPNNIIDSPLFQHQKAWWLPFIPLAITLFGILFQGWNLMPIIVLFWWEVILMVGTALVRMIFALDNQPFLNTLFSKIGMLIGGVVMGGVFIMFSVVFTFRAFENGADSMGLGKMAMQIRILQFSYLMGLIVHYFANGRYKTASPMGEMMSPFVHLLVLLAFLQALTMHLIPKYPQLNQALWVAVALVVLKFLVDMLFSKINKPFKQVFQHNETE
jgi:Family of unknown function (DUF6498)